MADSRDFKNKNTKFTGTEGIEIPSGGTGARGGSPAVGTLRYNSDLGFVEQYNVTGWAGIDAPPTITNITGTINASLDSTITVTGSNFKSGSTITVEGPGVNNVARNVATTFVNASELTFATAASSVNYVGSASFGVRVTNPSGLAYLLDPAGTVDSTLTWNTSAGSLGTLLDSQRGNTITVSATDPDGAVTYSVVSGSLPAGASLDANNGQITGFSAVGSDTTSSFTIRATQAGIGVDRAFSIIVRAPNSASGGSITTNGTYKTHVFTSSQSFTVNSTQTGGMTAEVLVVAAGGSGGSSYANNCSNGGGGAGGLCYQASRTVNTGTYTVNVGLGGGAISTTARGNNGGNSQFDTITAIGGGGGGGGAGNFNANNGGSGGGAAWPGNPGNPGNATQGNSGGATGYGNAGNINGNAGPDWGGGGAGGAGAQGDRGFNTRGGDGGAGRQYVQFTQQGVSLGSPAGWFAGGGAGAACDNGPSQGAGNGGQGGGGLGGGTTGGQQPGSQGVDGTGGGGGGGGPDNPSGRGGNGIVIVRYQT
jgi:hypothetical protein